MKRIMSTILLFSLTACIWALAEGEAPDGPANIAEPKAAESTLLPAPEDLNGIKGEEHSTSFALWFQEGFSLRLPEGWMSYSVDETDAAAGIRYALGDGHQDHFLYIQFTPTEIADISALEKAVELNAALNKTGMLTFGGVEFITYIDTDRSASCCSALWNGELLTLIFVPQGDADYMLTASKLMESFTRV